MELLSLLIGVPIGIICSFCAWWLIYHYFTPKIEFSAQIGKLNDSDTNSDSDEDSEEVPVYRFRFRNTGRRRIIDLKVTFKLTISSIKVISGGVNYTSYYFKPRSEFRPYLDSRDYLIINTWFPNLHDILKKKISEKSSYLEELLQLQQGGTIELIVFGTDSFSGTQKLFTSKRYELKDIKYGLFKKNSLEIAIREDSNNNNAKS